MTQGGNMVNALDCAANSSANPGTVPGTAGARPDSPQPRGHRRRALLWLILAAIFALIALGAAWLVLQTPKDDLIGLEAFMWRLKYAGLAVQLAALGLAAWRWSALVDWAVRRGWLRQSEQRAALAARGKAVLLVLTLILIAAFGPGDMARLMHLFMN
jgi:hypothetical protein